MFSNFPVTGFNHNDNARLISSSMSAVLRERSGIVGCFCLAAALEAAFLSAQNGAGFIWTKKTRITFLLFQLCSSRLCGSIARVNTRNGANARALESFLVVPSVLPTSPLLVG